jgi:dTDP-4-amino-4,6-dideoxygalactose transaminase
LSKNKTIFVTQPFLPPLEEFIPYLQKVWDSKILTNGGPFHQQLESALATYLGVGHVSLFSNGTIALMTALQALGISGEVITTPYSFVATAHSQVWNGITPVFIDVDPDTLNLDPSRIEEAITPNTTAIMPVHCYGNPCDVREIQRLADKHNLKIIYDAAHAFGVETDSGSVLSNGDLSVLSFHATKVFNTFEGGAIISPDAQTKARIDRLKNFGFIDEVTVCEAGLNGKMSEINAAFGMLQLTHVKAAIAGRRKVDEAYRELLWEVPGVRFPKNNLATAQNYSYFPVLIGPEFPCSRDDLFNRLKEGDVLARRYFYPLISEFQMYRDFSSADPGNLPVATAAARQVICLPIYPELKSADIEHIVNIIKGA